MKIASTPKSAKGHNNVPSKHVNRKIMEYFKPDAHMQVRHANKKRNDSLDGNSLTISGKKLRNLIDSINSLRAGVATIY